MMSCRVSEVGFVKTRLLHLGNVEKPRHPQFSARRAPEGQQPARNKFGSSGQNELWSNQTDRSF